tara:strand:- start:250 stop:639 length:390 start_codon:yes stop_codon:yes gene_type:complete
MDEFYYLIAIALIEFDGIRSMPIGGKALKITDETNYFPKVQAETIALEILLRILQKSDTEPLQRVANDKSLIIAKISMEIMQKKIPELKRDWIKTGNTEAFLSQMNLLCNNLYDVNFVKYEGIKFSKCK